MVNGEVKINNPKQTLGQKINIYHQKRNKRSKFFVLLIFYRITENEHKEVFNMFDVNKDGFVDA